MYFNYECVNLFAIQRMTFPITMTTGWVMALQIMMTSCRISHRLRYEEIVRFFQGGGGWRRGGVYCERALQNTTWKPRRIIRPFDNIHTNAKEEL